MVLSHRRRTEPTAYAWGAGGGGAQESVAHALALRTYTPTTGTSLLAQVAVVTELPASGLKGLADVSVVYRARVVVEVHGHGNGICAAPVGIVSQAADGGALVETPLERGAHGPQRKPKARATATAAARRLSLLLVPHARHPWSQSLRPVRAASA